ncbi:MAG TPA: NUDIX hydrolase [Candidatus Limnocylindria bacterium]|nr:NUDIX hydrolase [Candidatus Limnocylindria bacterium]
MTGDGHGGGGTRGPEVVAGVPRSRGPDARSTDLLAGGGPPEWLAASLNHCTRCGGPLRLGPVAGDPRERLVCAACSNIAYLNPKLVVSTLPVTDAGEIVLLRRGYEPGRGLWAQPGGFLEVDETATEGAVRETEEEIGLIVEPGEIMGLYARLEAAVIVLAYEARIVGGELHTTPEALAVQAFAPEAIPWPEIAFRTTWWALVDWLARRRPDIPPPADRWLAGGPG